MASEERFGYEWHTYPSLDTNYAQQFRWWAYPLHEADFAGKDVLDAGCGMGRNAYYALTWGARHVIAFDHDARSVAAAQKNLATHAQAKVVFQNIYSIPWKEHFDLVMCIGVLHHLKDPGHALRNFYASLRPNGRVLLWVYAYEGNEWIPRYVDPIRKNITSKLPVGLVHVLSYLCSLPLWLYVKLRRPRTGYLSQLAQFKLWHIHSIVFDQLIPVVAHYWRRDEVIALLEQAGYTNIQVERVPHGSGWTAVATKV